VEIGEILYGPREVGRPCFILLSVNLEIVQPTIQVTALREQACPLGPETLRVEKLDLLDPYDVAHTLKITFDILVNNAGIGEGGLISEISVELVRKNFETNVFAAASLLDSLTRQERVSCPAVAHQTLNLKNRMSPSLTTYSLPSERSRPFSFTACSLPSAKRSSDA
jgi:NAD(P)-dependent dehydrogenase (short-subunit alcohol dehydrogenase family)